MRPMVYIGIFRLFEIAPPWEIIGKTHAAASLSHQRDQGVVFRTEDTNPRVAEAIRRYHREVTCRCSINQCEVPTPASPCSASSAHAIAMPFDEESYVWMTPGALPVERCMTRTRPLASR